MSHPRDPDSDASSSSKRENLRVVIKLIVECIRLLSQKIPSQGDITGGMMRRSRFDDEFIQEDGLRIQQYMSIIGIFVMLALLCLSMLSGSGNIATTSKPIVFETSTSTESIVSKANGTLAFHVNNTSTVGESIIRVISDAVPGSETFMKHLVILANKNINKNKNMNMNNTGNVFGIYVSNVLPTKQQPFIRETNGNLTKQKQEHKRAVWSNQTAKVLLPLFRQILPLTNTSSSYKNNTKISLPPRLKNSFSPRLTQKNSFSPRLNQKNSFYPRLTQKNSFYPRLAQKKSFYPRLTQNNLFYPKKKNSFQLTKKNRKWNFKIPKPPSGGDVDLTLFYAILQKLLYYYYATTHPPSEETGIDEVADEVVDYIPSASSSPDSNLSPLSLRSYNSMFGDHNSRDTDDSNISSLSSGNLRTNNNTVRRRLRIPPPIYTPMSLYPPSYVSNFSSASISPRRNLPPSTSVIPNSGNAKPATTTSTIIIITSFFHVNHFKSTAKPATINIGNAKPVTTTSTINNGNNKE